MNYWAVRYQDTILYNYKVMLNFVRYLTFNNNERFSIICCTNIDEPYIHQKFDDLLEELTFKVDNNIQNTQESKYRIIDNKYADDIVSFETLFCIFSFSIFISISTA